MMTKRHVLSRRNHRSRAGVMLEFAMVFPLALGIMLFSVDMGRLVLMSTGLHDATAVAARAGARQGVVGTSIDGPPRTAFNEAIRVLPGLEESVNAVTDGPSFTVLTPTSDFCTRSQSFVRVSSTANVSLITPGLGLLLGDAGDPYAGARSLTIGASAVAKCEVTRG